MFIERTGSMGGALDKVAPQLYALWQPMLIPLGAGRQNKTGRTPP